ncbi:YggU family protein [Candidatus Woesearchaeota archaeon]|nr:YggU family protein [Candidatus Woesearchaeota archaeon]
MVSVKERTFSVIVKPNSSRNEIVGYDKERRAYKVSIAAPADGGKANKELVKFLSKELKRKVRIKSGFTSRKKLLSD